MKIKWERNSRSKQLADQGKIKHEDVINKTQTQNFPAGTATVRMARMASQHPAITLHIRGKSKLRTYQYSSSQQQYECAETCRVNFGGDWQGKADKTMNSNGVLDEDYSWQDVHNAVEEVKELMGI